MSERGRKRRRRRGTGIAGRGQAQVLAGESVALVIALVLFLYIIRTVLLPFVLAGIIAYVCTPLVRRLKRHLSLPRWVAALVVLLVLVALAAVVAWLGFPPLLKEVSRITADLGGTIESLMRKLMGGNTFELLGSKVSASEVADYTVNSLRTWFSQDARLLGVAAIGFSWMFGVILTVVVLGYFLIDAQRIGDGLFWLVPPTYRQFASHTWRELDPVLRRYFVGVALIVIYASIAAYIGLGLMLGLEHAIVLALLTGFLEVIPLVGPAASAIIAGLVAVQEAASTAAIVAYIIYAIALRISIDQFFGPIVLGRAGHVPPVLVIFCFLTGGLLFGIVGVVLAVPTALTIRIILHVLYDEVASRPDTPEKP